MRQICPLYQTPYYSYTIDLSDEAYELRLRWNSRAELWYLELSDAEENVIIRNVALVPSFRLLEQFSLDEIPGEFVLLPFSGDSLADSALEDPREIYKTHYLLYTDQDFE